MKHIRSDPNPKATERISLAMTPSKAHIFKRICKFYKRNGSDMLNGMVDEFLADELFNINKEKNFKKLGLNGKIENYAKKIIDDETCPRCKTRRIHSVFCSICLIEDKIEKTLETRKMVVPYLENQISKSTDEDFINEAKETIKKIKNGKYIFGDEESLQKNKIELRRLKTKEGKN